MGGRKIKGSERRDVIVEEGRKSERGSDAKGREGWKMEGDDRTVSLVRLGLASPADYSETPNWQSVAPGALRRQSRRGSFVQPLRGSLHLLSLSLSPYLSFFSLSFSGSFSLSRCLPFLSLHSMNRPLSLSSPSFLPLLPPGPSSSFPRSLSTFLARFLPE